MTTFYLLRHGEPDWDFKEERQLNAAMRDFVPLTANGVKQAEQVMEVHPYLSECEIIISSPYTRSLQTASLINRFLGKPLQVEFDLHEWIPDRWQAQNVQEIKELWNDYKKHDGCYPIGETRLWETKENIHNRTRGVLKKYTNYSKVIVVCHAVVISALLNISKDINLCGVHEFHLTINKNELGK
ncbi:histidine phosphatase family protein [Chengkuizengella axinellae]|uniref:Histidine phosphatase family protein n=1 Tax=Chengkuizengella axinellae TaxID=3064388 RepID=A0ABT9IU62_9BACL|nr:histidine phosphatase family protein [Chengkuizengella sp. 2205SS18-9]MDP5272847.1 histidine phosphatase family protein [Chengkuizengella sp. 2205SS18-9]